MKLSEVLRLREAIKEVKTKREVYSFYGKYNVDGVIKLVWNGWCADKESAERIAARYEGGTVVCEDGHTCPICGGIAPDTFGVLCPECSGRLERAMQGEDEVVDDEEIVIPTTKAELLAEIKEAGDRVIIDRDRWDVIETKLTSELEVLEDE